MNNCYRMAFHTRPPSRGQGFRLANASTATNLPRLLYCMTRASLHQYSHFEVRPLFPTLLDDAQARSL